MVRALVLSDWLAQRLDRSQPTPLYLQLHTLLQEAILSRMLPAGSKLPSSRVLATEIGLGRNTVTQVYEQLNLEGFVSAGQGRGTFVQDTARDEFVREDRPALAPEADTDAGPLSLRGEQLVVGSGFSARQSGAFMPGVPDLTRFPGREWARLTAKLWRQADPALMTYAPAGGLERLRKVLAAYLQTSRSVRCSPDQIVITTGIHQSIDLAARLLTDVGDAVWTEDPCYWGIRSVLQVSGLQLKGIAVDDEGMAPSVDDLAVPPKLIIVTPSHQYPLGMVMSLARRQFLSDYATRQGAWIIEDDYDSEFRYGRRPLASLQGMSGAERVIYVGSFGKTLFPGLRIGYMVVPDRLAAPFARSSAELYREGQLFQQQVLAQFMEEGHFTSHIRRMRGLYSQRRDVLLSLIEARYGSRLTIHGGDAGLHLVLALPDGVDDRRVCDAALAAGVIVRPLSTYFADAALARPGLLLGYASVPDHEIVTAFANLSTVIDRFLR